MSIFDNLIDELRLLYPDEPLQNLSEIIERLVNFYQICAESTYEINIGNDNLVPFENKSNKLN